MRFYLRESSGFADAVPNVPLYLIKLDIQRHGELSVQNILCTLHGRFGPAAAGLLLGHPAAQPLDHGDQRFIGVELEELAIERVHMIEAAVVADRGGDPRHGINQSVRFVPADDRPHEGVGIHRRKVGSGTDQGCQVVI